MAYGVTCSSLLLTLGHSPITASASVHAAEVLTSGISGHFHWRLGNVDPQLFRNLVWPGAIGAVIGVWALTSFPADAVTPWVALYLGLMGARILYKSVRSTTTQRASRFAVKALAFVGGFLDAVGGGGWGPIVTSSLVGQGWEPRQAIGSVNRAEFFVTATQVAVFVSTIGLTNLRVIAALTLGGALAAPLAALVARRVQPRPLMAAVGIVIIVLSIRTLLRSW